MHRNSFVRVFNFKEILFSMNRKKREKIKFYFIGCSRAVQKRQVDPKLFLLFSQNCQLREELLKSTVPQKAMKQWQYKFFTPDQQKRESWTLPLLYNRFYMYHIIVYVVLQTEVREEIIAEQKDSTFLALLRKLLDLIYIAQKKNQAKFLGQQSPKYLRKENWKLIILRYAPLVNCIYCKSYTQQCFLACCKPCEIHRVSGNKDVEKKLMTTNHIVHK